jgi:hypothetical protein
MEKWILLILTAVAVSPVCAQNPTDHEWKVTLKVVDDTGQPVVGANASVGYYSQSRPASIDGLTDTNGIFMAAHSAKSGHLGFSAEKSGYYTTREASYDLGFAYDATRWNPVQTIILKKIGQPIPLHARNARIEIPKVGEAVGFDLVEYDWVAPYGKGKRSDLICLADRRWVSRNDFDCALRVTFTDKGDGFIPVSVPPNQGSKLRLAAIAPSEGYVAELSKSLGNTPVGGWKDDEREGNKGQNYYFRVRTVLDDQGNVVSALYGKIHDDFALDPINSKTLKILFTYYLNPTPNDRNVEFDTKRNLAKNVKPLEEVKAP